MCILEIYECKNVEINNNERINSKSSRKRNDRCFIRMVDVWKRKTKI
jgi:hypothetical protein